MLDRYKPLPSQLFSYGSLVTIVLVPLIIAVPHSSATSPRGTLLPADFLELMWGCVFGDRISCTIRYSPGVDSLWRSGFGRGYSLRGRSQLVGRGARWPTAAPRGELPTPTSKDVTEFVLAFPLVHTLVCVLHAISSHAYYSSGFDSIR